MKLRICYVLSLVVLLAACKHKSDALMLNKDNIDDVVAAMTDEEKALLLIGGALDKNLLDDYEDVVDRVPGAAGSNNAIERLGIPAIVFADGPAGVRILPTRKDDPNTYYATAFPIGTELACTWNTELVKQVGASMGNEAKEYGIDVLLAPGMNIHRNPLCGRNYEYYSEDPVVAGNIAAAMVQGIQSNGIGASVKHFIANNQETHRMGIDVEMSERAFREIYLRGFEIAIGKSKPWTVMSSYNKIYGEFASENKYLLSDILRYDLGYEGTVISDWYGGYSEKQVMGMMVNKTKPTSNVKKQLEAGNDLIMPGNTQQYDKLLEEIKSGSISKEVVDGNIKKVLQLIVKTSYFNNYKNSNKPNLKEHAQVARYAAEEGMVLLKNEKQTLPIKSKSEPVSVFGNTSYNFVAGGTGSGKVNEAYSVSLMQGLDNAGYNLDEELVAKYEPYVEKTVAAELARRKKAGFMAAAKHIPELDIEDKLIHKKAKTTSIALITVGNNGGEMQDRPAGEGGFEISSDQVNLIKRVSSAFHKQNKPVVVIINSGGVVGTAKWESMVDAVLMVWQPGQEGGNALVDLLSGKATPSGKLTMSIPLKYSDTPSSDYFPGNDTMVNYEEGIYVGYRYFDTEKVEVAHEFGYGLSYTNFEYSDLKIDDKSNNVSASVTIKNTGKYKGKEVVQLYVSAPSESINKPSKELKAFVKTRLLEPGESQTVKLAFNKSDMASFLETKPVWVLEKGTYTVKVGSSSKDIRAKGTIEIAKEMLRPARSPLNP